MEDTRLSNFEDSAKPRLEYFALALSLGFIALFPRVDRYFKIFAFQV
jgi:hypothetical protein